jgi:hypothetical protein
MASLKKGGPALGLVMLVGLAAPVTSFGQQKKVEVAAFAASHFPTTDDGLERAVRDAQRRASLAWGGRLTAWVTNSVGVELTGGYSRARVRVVATNGIFPRSTDVVFGSGKVALNLTPGSRGLGFVLSGGVAGVRFGSTVTNPDSSSNRVGAVAGAGLRLPIGGSGIILRGDIEDYVYRADFGLGKKTAHDLVVGGGLSLAF